MTFIEKLQDAWTRNNSLLCVGLDPDADRLPSHLRGKPNAIFEFCKGIVDATADPPRRSWKH
jgi:orotidine-5'-phosphate decarboxylase